MLKTVGITLNPNKKDIFKKVLSIIDWLKEREVEVLVLREIGRNFPLKTLVSIEELREKAQLIISLGGDGTLFRAARDFSPYQVPLLGINLGGLGFLTEIPISKFEEGLEKVLSGNYKIEKRLMLQTSVYRKGKLVKSSISLNDVVIGKAYLPRIINFKTFVSNELVTTYSADGLIISTPTGSTAYSLSAGGPVVDPKLKVVILSPICAHTLAVRPLIISSEETVNITLEPPAKEILLAIDGQIGFPLKEEDTVEIKKAPYQALLVRIKERAFFKILRAKLGWSGVSYTKRQRAMGNM